jgi:hydroxyacylglutathione hydrolase
VPLPQLTSRVAELDPTRPTVVYCASGYRSSIAASALAAAGFADVSDLLGGYEAWNAAAKDEEEQSS